MSQVYDDALNPDNEFTIDVNQEIGNIDEFNGGNVRAPEMDTNINQESIQDPIISVGICVFQPPEPTCVFICLAVCDPSMGVIRKEAEPFCQFLPQFNVPGACLANPPTRTNTLTTGLGLRLKWPRNIIVVGSFLGYKMLA